MDILEDVQDLGESFVSSFLPALLTAFVTVNAIACICGWALSRRKPPPPRWVLPKEATEIEVKTDDGAVLVGWTKGQGQDVILLHGMGGLSTSYHFLFKRLSTKGFRVTAVDLRCHGESGGSENLSARILASDLAAVLDQINARNAMVIGYDLGGYATLACCSFHPTVIPTRVKGIVLLSSYAVRPEAWHFGIGAFVTSSGLLHALCRSKYLANTWSRSFFGRVTNKTMQEEWRRMFLANPPRTTTQAVHATSEDLTPHLSQMRAPVLVVCGESDSICRASQGVMLKALRGGSTNVEMVWLKGMGHELVWEAPDRLTAMIAEFAASIEDAARPDGGDID